MSLSLALHDAANNCTRENATAVLTLQGGVVVEGRLEISPADLNTVHLKFAHGGWGTYLVEGIIGVESRR